MYTPTVFGVVLPGGSLSVAFSCNIMGALQSEVVFAGWCWCRQLKQDSSDGTHLSVVGLLAVAAVGIWRSLYGTGLNVVIFLVLFSLSHNNQLCTGPNQL
jgi:hypothetical protein